MVNIDDNGLFKRYRKPTRMARVYSIQEADLVRIVKLSIDEKASHPLIMEMFAQYVSHDDGKVPAKERTPRPKRTRPAKTHFPRVLVNDLSKLIEQPKERE